MIRLAFFGTSDFALASLRALSRASGVEIAAVYTQAPKAAGRNMHRRLSPVAHEAELWGLKVMFRANLRDDDATQEFLALGCDAAIVVSYGMILPPAFLSAVSMGFWNLHPSDLPRWRGAAPMQRALLAGDYKSAVCVQRMVQRLDEGPIAVRQEIVIGEHENYGELSNRCADIGADLILRLIEALTENSVALAPQTGATSYASKVDKAELRIDWNRSAPEIARQVRAFAPLPGAWTNLISANKENTPPVRLRILSAKPIDKPRDDAKPLDDAMMNAGAIDTASRASGELIIQTGDGELLIERIQPAGKSPMATRDYLRGLRSQPLALD